MVRLKHRYVISQVLIDPTFGCADVSILTAREILAVLREKIQQVFGDCGARHASGLAIRFFDEHTLIFVLRTSRESETEVRFAMSLITTIKKINLVVRGLKICGSVRTCTQRLKEVLEVAVANSGLNSDSIRERTTYYSTFIDKLEL